MRRLQTVQRLAGALDGGRAEKTRLGGGGRTLGSIGWVISGLMLLAWTASHATERYAIAPQQSQVQFKAYSVFAKPVGKFHTFSGEILADAQQLSASQVRLVIEARSIDTDNAQRDKHLRSEAFLFVEKYPTLTFVSTAITGAGPTYTIQGDLTMRGMTQRLTIPVTVEQHQNDIVVRGHISLSRKAFGITYNALFNPVQDKVDVLFTIVGVKQ